MGSTPNSTRGQRTAPVGSRVEIVSVGQFQAYAPDTHRCPSISENEDERTVTLTVAGQSIVLLDEEVAAAEALLAAYYAHKLDTPLAVAA